MLWLAQSAPQITDPTTALIAVALGLVAANGVVLRWFMGRMPAAIDRQTAVLEEQRKAVEALTAASSKLTAVIRERDAVQSERDRAMIAALDRVGQAVQACELRGRDGRALTDPGRVAGY